MTRHRRLWKCAFPSRRRQIPAIAVATRASGEKCGETARPLDKQPRHTAEGPLYPGYLLSAQREAVPGKSTASARSGSRLVAITRVAPFARNNASAICAAASRPISSETGSGRFVGGRDGVDVGLGVPAGCPGIRPCRDHADLAGELVARSGDRADQVAVGCATDELVILPGPHASKAGIII